MADEPTPTTERAEILGTPTIGATPVALDPNGMYIVPGVNVPLKGEQLRDGLMYEADHTRKTQALAERQRELDALEARANDSLYITSRLQENWDEAIEELRPIFKGESMPEPSHSNGNGNGQQAQVQLPPEVTQLIQAQGQQIEQMRAELYGYMANTQLTGEMSGLESRDSRFKDDIDLRGRVVRRAAELRIPLKEAYMLETYDEKAKEASDARSERDAIEFRRIIPSLGGSARAVEQIPLDSDALFEQEFMKNYKEQGYLDQRS